MTEEIIIDVNGCPHKSDDDCMKVPICNEYGDLMGYQSCEAQTLCPYRSQKKIERLEQENKELKSDVLKWQKAFSRQYQINENKGYSKAEENYRSALEEIRDYCDRIEQGSVIGTQDCLINSIKNITNEVLNA